ncbi:peptidase inhibitor family I36 protein [Streptomyces sp. NBC_01716]|uniref:peptidase inhibitor family I36 protein n=1 Tax=Streptomyces sp. NBC_01716 TaxID=2975917 RepID=UPI002E364796|nr:peptidase inhibitor family I36 protein [Streptomyces sp. NBC_01716]
MRKFIVAAALTGLTALGIAAPATTAHATGSTVAGPGCNDKWGPRDGNMYAWQNLDCQGTLLIRTAGNSTYWGASATDKATSVMNRGFLGGRDIVKFYEDIDYKGGHTCLYPEELYADDVTDNRFHNGYGVNDRITSHQWVTAASCSGSGVLT